MNIQLLLDLVYNGSIILTDEQKEHVKKVITKKRHNIYIKLAAANVLDIDCVPTFYDGPILIDRSKGKKSNL